MIWFNHYNVLFSKIHISEFFSEEQEHIQVVVEKNLQHEEEKHTLIENTEQELGHNGKIVKQDTQKNNDDSIWSSEADSFRKDHDPFKNEQNLKNELNLENQTVDMGSLSADKGEENIGKENLR